MLRMPNADQSCRYSSKTAINPRMLCSTIISCIILHKTLGFEVNIPRSTVCKSRQWRSASHPIHGIWSFGVGNAHERRGGVELFQARDEEVIVMTETIEKDEISNSVTVLEDEEKSSISTGSDDNTALLTTTDDIQEGILPNYSLILGLTFSVAILSALDRVAMSVAILPLSQELHLTETAKGLISSSFSAGYGLAIIPCGILLATVSARSAMAAGVTLWSVGTYLTPMAASSASWVLLMTRGVVGAAESVVLPAVQRILSVWVPDEKRSSAMAGVFSGFHLGTILAYLLSPTVMELSGGWRGMFYVYGAAGLAWLWLWLTFAKDAPSQEQSINPSLNTQNNTETTSNIINDTKDNNDSNDIIQSFKSAPWKSMLTSPSVWSITIAHAANNWGLYNNLAWTPTFYQEQYNLNTHDSAFLSVLPSVAGALFGLTAGFTADKLILRSNMDVTTVRKLFQGTALLGPAACLLYLSQNIPETAPSAQLLLTASMGLQSFMAAGYGPACQEKAGEKWSSLLYSMTSLPGVLFGTCGVTVTGMILDATEKNWSDVFALNAVIYVVGATAFLGWYNGKKEFD